MIKICKHAVLITLLALTLASCRDSGCIYADDFGGESFTVRANPESVYGQYPYQSTDWIETGLRVTGEEVRILISGSWITWPTSINPDDGVGLDSIPSCFERTQDDYNPVVRDKKNLGLCAKRIQSGSVVDTNCICYKGESLISMPNVTNDGLTTSCNQGSSGQPDSCACQVVDPSSANPAISDGSATEGDCVVHFTLADKFKENDPRAQMHPPSDNQNPLDMDEVEKAVKQGYGCRFHKGMGLYIGLFGISGNEQPKRVYHLFTQEEQCPIRRNAAGECAMEVDGVSQDRTRYLYTHSGNFVKDDRSGNNCTVGQNTADDIYHGRRELVKLKIHDTYFRDNMGSYNIEFQSGFYSEGEMGILEWIVTMIEEIMIGEVDMETGDREGGLLRVLYSAIVMNSNFTTFVQMVLVLYITFFGLSTLLGVVDLTKKELITKILQIGVIMMFTSADGWQMYYDYFVNFFKVGMDQVINRISLFSNSLLSEGEGTQSVIRAAMLRSANPDSMGAKFAYVDGVIRMLFSEAVTKKIWSLFFYSFFGFIYIFLIYCVIFYFLYTMSVVAFVYCILLTKLIIGLVLGPVFIVFMLFKKTNEYFRKWIGFLAARALEGTILFLLLFILVRMIDQKFNELLYYSACIIEWELYLFKLKWLVAQNTPNAGYEVHKWLMDIAEVAIVIYVTKQIIMQIPKLAGGLISVGGSANSAGGESYAAQGFAIAESTMSGLFSSAAGKASSLSQNVAGKTFRGLRYMVGSTAIGRGLDKIRGPRSAIRDKMIDGEINKFAKIAESKGLTGIDRDQFIRNSVLNNQYKKNGNENGVRAWAAKNKNKAALLNLNTDAVVKRLNKRLLQDGMKDFLKEKAEEYKNAPPGKALIGDKLKRQLEKDAIKWASENTSVDRMTQERALKKLTKDSKVWFSKDKWGWRRSFFDDLTTMGAGRASSKKRFGGRAEAKEEYLSHLRTRQFEKMYKGDNTNINASKVGSSPSGSEDFTRKAHANQKEWYKLSRYGPFSRRNKYNKDEQNYNAARNTLMSNHFQDRKKEISDWFDEKKGSAMAQFGGDLYIRQIDQSKQDKVDKLNRERNYFKDTLKKEMVLNYTEEYKSFEGDKKKQAELKKRLSELFEEVKKKANEKALYEKGINRDNIRDGLINVGLDKDFTINGKTYKELSLFEARAMLEAFGGKPEKIGVDDDLFARIEQADEEAEKVAALIEKNAIQEEKTMLEKILSSNEEEARREIALLENSKEKSRLEKMLELQVKLEDYRKFISSGTLCNAQKMMLKHELEMLLRDPDLTAEKYTEIVHLMQGLSETEKPKDITREDNSSKLQQYIDDKDLMMASKSEIIIMAEAALVQNDQEIVALYTEYAKERVEYIEEIKVLYNDLDSGTEEVATKQEYKENVEALADEDLKVKMEKIESDLDLEISKEEMDQFCEQQVAEVNMMDEQIVKEVIVRDIEVEFGKDISQALALDAGSVVVEAADVSIGGGGGSAAEVVDQALKSSYEATIKGHELKIKTSKNNKKFLEYESQNLQQIINSKKSSEIEKSAALQRKTALDSEISSLEATISREERSRDAAQDILTHEVTFGKSQY